MDESLAPDHSHSLCSSLHWPQMSLPPQHLRELPYPAQICAIDIELAEGRTEPLLRELCTYRDYQPLAYALASLADAGALLTVDASLIPLLLEIPDTGLRRVLRALDEVETPASFTEALADGAWQLPIERIAAVAMIDRWLKNTAPQDRQRRAEAGLAHCTTSISESSVDRISDSHLMRLPGTALSSLDDLAKDAGCLDSWVKRQKQFAEKILDVLESQPKSLSQANAEELLSRQVYTDPGHFLVELLQNADDAGASLWKVQVFDDRIEVEHDGTPFDALDLVGILSIGQTTKSKEQIGFFGVGFKSVYEICERPQLYSGVFSLEIADVSIPRLLRPLNQVLDGRTRLVLPLRQGRDASVSPEKLYQTLADLPAEVVLTLNSVRELDLRYGDHIRHVRGLDEEKGRFRIDDGEHSKRYLIERTEAHYQGSRGMHRASRTPVLVAVPLDRDGFPTPIQGAPTIYSYLPTNERSGLRFLVHAHFDLPVDRERIDLSSDWNQWALTQVGILLRNMISRLCEECTGGVGNADPDGHGNHDKGLGTGANAGRMLDAVLNIVSLPGELHHPAFEVIGSELRSLEFLRGADGNRYAASAALLCDDKRLRDAFAAVPLQGERYLLSKHLGRDAEVATWLGARRLETSAIVDEMARDARTRGPGERFDPPWSAKLPGVLAALSDTSVSLKALQEVACLPDGDGLAQIPANLNRASPDLRAFLSHLQPLVRDDMESPRCSTTLDTLGVKISRVRDLVTLCADGESARRLVDKVSAAALIRFLHAAPPAELELVAFANIVPDDRDSLSAIGETWLTGRGALATLIRRTKIRPRLVALDTEEVLRASLEALGSRTLDISAILACMDRQELCIDDWSALHTSLDAMAHDIPPNVAKRLAQAPIFPTRNSGALPLLGEVVASIPCDQEITEIWPAPAWLTQDVARLPYLRSLGVAVVGPEDLAATLLTTPVPEARRSCFAYLAKHGLSLSTSTTEALAHAPIWPDTSGILRPIDDLRRSAQLASVAALYEVWPQAMTVEADNAPGSALELALAIHLDHRIVSPDLETAIHDLRNLSTDSAFQSGIGLDLEDPHTASIVTNLLNEAAETLPGTILNKICEAPLFLCKDGVHRRLGMASEPRTERALRVSGFLIPAFESLGFSVLSEESSQALAPLLDALKLHPATLIDLVRHTSIGDTELQEESAAQFRQALCNSVASLATLDASLRGELSNLAMWPYDGRLVAAKCVVRGRSLDALLEGAGLDPSVLSACTPSSLSPKVEQDAETLSRYLNFASPANLLAETIQKIALVNEPISSQPELLASTEQVARLAMVLAVHHDEPWTLPISVTASSRLVARPLQLATDDELLACAALDLLEDLAHPEWSAILVTDETIKLSWLAPRRLLDAIREVSGETQPAKSHKALADPGARGAFYRWLLMHAQDISEDEQSLGLLGKSAVILSEQGFLRGPRELLFDLSLPDLGIDWNASGEVSQELQDWLRASYRPASKQLRPIVDHMARAIDDAASDGDGERIAAVLEHLARLLRASNSNKELEELAKRFKLRKRLRVETEDGQFEYARRLLAAEPLDADLVPRFALAPPASVAQRYRQPQILRLLRASGAADELGVAALRSYLGGENRCSGNDSDIAFACYLGSAAHRQAPLRGTLDLRRQSWLPDALGNLHPASALYWPSPEIESLIGRDAHLYVHTEFVLRVSGAREWLPVRETKHALLSDIAAHFQACASKGEPANADALIWLDAQLAESSLSNKDVRAALANIPMLVDDHGQMRCASELIVAGGRRLFGERRGNWSPGTRLRHLAKALVISRTPQANDILRFLAQVHREFVTHPEILQGDTATLEALPRCLDALIELGGRAPQSLLVTATKGGEPVLLVLPAPSKSVGLPQELEDSDIILRMADGGDLIAWQGFLRAYGIGPALEQGLVPAKAQLPSRPIDSLDEYESQELARKTEEEPEGPGVISRLRSWIRGKEDDDDAPAPQLSQGAVRAPQERGRKSGSTKGQDRPEDAEPPPFSPVDQRGWFRGNNSLNTQLASNPSWLADRTQVAEFGLAHAPHQLPIPHRYAPNVIFSNFDKGRQQWKPSRGESAWSEGGARVGRLHMRGKLPSPEAQVPLPLYGRLSDVEIQGEVKVVEGRDAVTLLSRDDPSVSFTIDLLASPNFSESTKGGEQKHLLQHCVADRELPEEVLDLVESLRNEDSALQITGVIRSFVRKRYVYDPTYLEDPQMAAWLQERSAGRSNVHIAALHAGADVTCLGRGVCYELNSLVCEMLRRAGVQAAVATGWTFDRGHIDEPDHLWAMALTQTSEGPRWLPVDASTTQNGRPLHAAHRPPGPWRADKRAARPLQEPKWDTIEHEQQAAESLPLGDLLRVARYLEGATGRRLGTRGEILAACREVLSDPERRAAFTDLLGSKPPEKIE